MDTHTTPLAAWLAAATPDEARALAAGAQTSVTYLRHLAAPESRAYRRQPSATMAAAVERAAAELRKASSNRLPELLRVDLLPTCRECPYARKCLGQRATLAEFPIERV